jgi:hypothetical protein
MKFLHWLANLVGCARADRDTILAEAHVFLEMIVLQYFNLTNP